MKDDQLSGPDDADDMLPEYDFSGGMRGKHYAAYQRGYTIVIHKPDGTTEERTYAGPEGTVVLNPDVRPYFPDAAAVNTALRGLSGSSRASEDTRISRRRKIRHSERPRARPARLAPPTPALGPPPSRRPAARRGA